MKATNFKGFKEMLKTAGKKLGFGRTSLPMEPFVRAVVEKPFAERRARIRPKNKARKPKLIHGRDKHGLGIVLQSPSASRKPKKRGKPFPHTLHISRRKKALATSRKLVVAA